jgi:hypothetical protein
VIEDDRAVKPGALVVVIAVIALTGCGGSSSSDDQIVDLPLDVGSVSAAVGQSMLKAIYGVYRVSYEARKEKDVHKRARMLRERIPPFVNMFEAGYQPTIDKLEALELRSAAGDELRSIEIDVIREWEQALSTLRTDLATSDSAWQAWVTFDDTKDEMVRRFGQRVNTFVASLPAPEQQMLRQAVAQTFVG